MVKVSFGVEHNVSENASTTKSTDPAVMSPSEGTYSISARLFNRISPLPKLCQFIESALAIIPETIIVSTLSQMERSSIGMIDGIGSNCMNVVSTPPSQPKPETVSKIRFTEPTSKSVLLGMYSVINSSFGANVPEPVEDH